jgi:hypothetical protein
MTKDIKGYDGLYFCNLNGEFFSYAKKTRKGIRKMKTIKHNSAGYLSIDLCKDGKVKKYLAHRLMAETFLDNPKNKEQVNHINGIKTDNRLENLEWSTRSENQKHSILIGLRTTNGEKNSQSKLTEQDVLYIRNSKEKGSILAKKFNISHPTICDIIKHRSWTHI